MKNENLVREMLLAIGDNPDREGLKDTPKRVVKMWEEIFKGYDKNQLPKVTTFQNGKDGIVYDEMIIDTGKFYSQCEHHLIPFIGEYFFGYIAHKDGKILGLSKVARVVDYFSSKLQVQERLGSEIIEYLWNELSKEGVEPIGMGLILKAKHLCKCMRGIKNDGIMITSNLKGVFKNQEVRQEFLQLIK